MTAYYQNIVGGFSPDTLNIVVNPVEAGGSLHVYSYDADTNSMVNANVTWLDEVYSTGQRPMISHDGQYIIATHDFSTSPQITVYEKTGTAEYTRKTTGIPSLPAGKTFGPHLFTLDGLYWIVESTDDSATNSLLMYAINGGTFTQVSSPFSALPSRAAARPFSRIAESPDQAYLAVINRFADYIIYRRDSAESWTSVATLTVTGETSDCAAWSPDSAYLLLMGAGTTPKAFRYTNNGDDTFTFVDDIVSPVLPGGSSNAHVAQWSDDGSILQWTSENRSILWTDSAGTLTNVAGLNNGLAPGGHHMRLIGNDKVFGLVSGAATLPSVKEMFFSIDTVTPAYGALTVTGGNPGSAAGANSLGFLSNTATFAI